MDLSLTAAILVGLMGAGHCFGMCGGLVGAFSSHIPSRRAEPLLVTQLKFQLAYNGGRLISYAAAGAIAAGLGQGLGQLIAVDDYLVYLRLLAGMMMILTGLYIARWFSGLLVIEAGGKRLWRYIQPIGQRILPLDTLPKATMAGMVWGWLPCGLVYSMLTWAIASGDVAQGALTMLAFGLGTLPALFFTGVATQRLARWLQNQSVKTISGLLLIGFGVQTWYVAYQQLSL
ncbi:sulfite exporter TauE/SafE family protein [Shewanella sp. NIFS-20-20]|uniref:sulfite exporter TauE/SafE family protein n=1 Tax=Shewanella sp. NIFS-20-20 TaxID=2853806 RepID=UPI001C446FA4|nr:sulfite exporter TauE/SafE family protein [Shewanella sp. NIFS-20-20]MBV7315697.1 sulfite exporter TauE/SafE family protein [Shewanella sp. NIFS-20-20]